MIGQGEYAYGRSSGANEAPLFTSDNWHALATSMKKGAEVAFIVAGASKAVAARDPDLKTKALFLMIAQGALETSAVAAMAAALAEKQATQAKEEEDKRDAAARETERQRSERARIERASVAKFEANLDRGWREHQERVNRGDFLREYKDTPIRERDFSRTA